MEIKQYKSLDWIRISSIFHCFMYIQRDVEQNFPVEPSGFAQALPRVYMIQWTPYS